MKPTKTAAKRVVKKRPAKRAVRKNSVEGKFLDLKYRINAHHELTGIDSKKDKSWVMRRINEVRSNQPLSKDALEYANKLWSDYEKYTV